MNQQATHSPVTGDNTTSTSTASPVPADIARTLDIMRARHAVRMYTDEPVPEEALAALRAEIDAINAAGEGRLHFQIATGLDDAFLGLKTHYGRFRGVHNAIALIGSDGSGRGDTLQSFKDAEGTPATPEATALQERIGYYGERLALRATELGLATSWAVLDGTDAVPAGDAWWTLRDGEALVWVLAFGHAVRPGAKHRSKPMEQLTDVPADAMPDWFRWGMEAAMLAPTSLSQQPFVVTLVGGHDDGEGAGAREDGGAREDDTHGAEAGARADITATEGLFAHVGVGAAKWHFEAVAGPEHCAWRM